jgi:P27 family predicted phage terminase small subunit
MLELMRGRKPKPAALKVAEGDTRKIGVHKLEQVIAAQPKASRGLPECPRHLKGRARRAWEFWAEELAVMNLDARPDAMLLEGLCTSYARAVEADLILAKEGLLVEESAIDPETGKRVVLKMRNHPAISVSRTSWAHVRAFCSEFGLSPAARMRVTAAPKLAGVDALELKLCG